MSPTVQNIAVVGGGLCGTLLAIRLAQLGYDVDLMERRPDMRIHDVDGGRSINLALSHRGLAGLSLIGLLDELSDDIIPMHGRMIHPHEGSPQLYKYSGREGEHINSISRGGLNIELLHFADRYEHVRTLFDVKVTKVDMDQNIIYYEQHGSSFTSRKYDLIFGADGAGSAVRRSFQRVSNRIRFDFSQRYLDTGYKELSIPPDAAGNWQIEKHALHIWPRNGHMMIALPNPDGSFTLTLFAKFEGPNSMETFGKDWKTLFEKDYTDALPYMSDIAHEWEHNPFSSLGMVKCYPWLYKRCMLIGDAAHAIVPFYGQGMNCSFEDVVVLDQLISQHDHDWDAILPAYQSERKKDTDAIADLAIDNFFEMRDDTADPIFNRKRKIEVAIEQQFPDYYSKYGLVTFRPDVPYSKAMSVGRAQDNWLMEIAGNYQDVSQVPLPDIYAGLMDIQNQMLL